MSPDEKPTGRSVTRGDFEIVIRRAVELAQVHADVDDRVSEAELIRIGGELGLPAEQVRQALYEQPQLDVDPRWSDRYFDKPIVSASRVLPTGSDVTMKRIEEYLSSNEYMQLVRRKQGELAFMPAEDAISRLARGLSRPGSRYHIAHARRVVVSIQSIGEGRTHVRMDTDFSEQRANSVTTGFVAGAVIGTFTGIFPAVSLVLGLELGAGTEVMIAGAAMAATVAGTIAISVRIAANGFRNRLLLARREIDGLLDRAEHTNRLEPPPAPWRQSLRTKFFGTPKP